MTTNQYSCRSHRGGSSPSKGGCSSGAMGPIGASSQPRRCKADWVRVLARASRGIEVRNGEVNMEVFEAVVGLQSKSGSRVVIFAMEVFEAKWSSLSASPLLRAQFAAIDRSVSVFLQS
ncbi:hypothetical protein NL676_012086 [Syzygium grande]|nr:hypothetical protein NL676_012086 [Syzygium grande]